jgi:hypothetical protein
LQPQLYLGDVLFGGAKRSPTGVHRVISEHEFVRAPYCRPEDEFGIGFGMEVDRLVRWVEDGEFARSTSSGTARLPVLSAIQQMV